MNAPLHHPVTEADPRDALGGWSLMHYVAGPGKGLMTMAMAISTPRDAMRACAEVGRWLQVDHTTWRSEDSRWLITDPSQRKPQVAA